jgi:hypothetical protein
MDMQRVARSEEARQRAEYNHQRAEYAATMEQAKRERLAARLQVQRGAAARGWLAGAGMNMRDAGGGDGARCSAAARTREAADAAPNPPF